LPEFNLLSISSWLFRKSAVCNKYPVHKYRHNDAAVQADDVTKQGVEVTSPPGGKRPHHPLNRRPDGPHSRSANGEWKVPDPARNRMPTV